LVKVCDELDNQIRRFNKKPDKEEREVLTRVEEMLKEKIPVRDGDWKSADIEWLNKHNFMTAKPVVYLVNIGAEEYKTKKNKWLPKIAAWINENGGGPMVPYSAEYEQQVLAAAGSPERIKREEAARELGAPSMMTRIIKVGYNALQLIHYFTAGEDEVKCWTIRQGTKAPQAAGVIHTDFERGFICAEVQSYADLNRLGSEMAVKAEGLYKQQGKEYEVVDGDVMFFKFNVTAPKKKEK